MAVGGYDGMAAVYEVVRRLNGNIDDKAMAVLKGLKIASPRGPIQIDADTRDIVQTVYVREVKKVGGNSTTSSSTSSSRSGPGQVGDPGSAAMLSLLGVLFDGIAYGMLLFLISVGLSVTAGDDELHQPGARRLRDGGGYLL